MTTRGLLLSFIFAWLWCTPSIALAENGHPQVPVLIYHEIGNPDRPPGETVISLSSFAEQMAYLKREGYTTISISDLLEYMAGRTSVPAKAVVLTFDDGWKNQLQAVPILNRYGFSASFWIIIEKGIGGDYMEWDDIKQIAANPRFEIGSHTLTHPWDPFDNLVTWVEGHIAGKDTAQALKELVDSKTAIEQRLRRPVDYLAWPVGWFKETLVNLARTAGYKAVLTAEDGGNTQGEDVYRIKRIFIDGGCDIHQFQQSLTDHRYHVCSHAPRVTHGHSPYPYQSGLPEPANWRQ